MFGRKKSEQDYTRVCQDPDRVYEFLYNDRRKTADIFSDESFVRAWLDSSKMREISIIVDKEAKKGDVPSLKQMVWLLGIMYDSILKSSLDKQGKSKALISLLEDRIAYCNQLTSLGIPNSYYAMISSHKLFRVIYDLNEPGDLTRTRNALNEMVKHAQEVKKMGERHANFDGDTGFIQDAQNILKEGADLRQLLNALGDNLSDLDGIK